MNIELLFHIIDLLHTLRIMLLLITDKRLRSDII